ncbi:MAG: alpha/beta fold hydrolase [Propionicimonas sp.]|uniref:alpha/beta fold hydrolase n=1 Tax=Propionicimonas sp. TaxID=1955623 RepID=UPI003D13B32E
MTTTPLPGDTRRDEAHFVRADDGVPLTLIRVRGASEPAKGPVLVLHGLGMRAESFRPPVPRSFVDALLDDGWDPWLLNWRGSLDLDPLPWTLDDVARYDVPAAVRYVREQTGADALPAVGHCAGAAALSMAAVAGLVPKVEVVVANGVSLHPVLPPLGRAKLRGLRPLLQHYEPYIDAAWGDGPETFVPLVTRTAVRLWHTECTNPTCNLASFAIGSGRDSLWVHANLDDDTHEWLRHEIGKIPMSYYHQLALSERAGQLVAVTDTDVLPRRYADAPPRTSARFALFTGDRNRTFLPAGQRATHEWLGRHRPGVDSLHVLPGYSHGDVFIGRLAHAEVFPLILAELNGGAR